MSGGMEGWLSGMREKAVGFFVRLLSLTNRQGWETETSSAGEEVSTDSLLGLSAAWACVNLWMGTVATLDCEVWRRVPGSPLPERVPGHWLQALLEGPNRDQTDSDCGEFMQASLEMRGNAYAEKRRLSPGGSIVALQPIRPDLVQAVRINGRIVYRFAGEDGVQRELDEDDVWHIRGPGGSPLGGLSTISFGRNAFGAAIAADRAAASMFKNGVQPSGLLKFKEWVKPQNREAAYDRIERDHAAARNAGKPLVLEGGVEWQQISFSPEDAQMLETRSFGVEDICRWFQVPPVLVGHTEKVSAWGTGIEEIIRGFVKFGLRRRVKRIEHSARQQLLSARERGEGYYLRFNLEGLMRGDPKTRGAFYEVMTRIGAKTINEVRALEGDKPVTGGDVPMIQSQNVPLGVTMAPKPVLLPPPPAA